MIEEAPGCIEYDECGSGPTIVLVPGSCSTGAAWRPVIAVWQNRFRCVTTSLPGYGRTAERRTAHDTSIARLAETVESVIAKAGGRVHLVGHSFGGLVAFAVALRHRVAFDRGALASLVMLEAPAMEVLRDEDTHYRVFRRMTEAYFADFAGGNRQAIAAMIDFYGGAGTWASWPPRVRDYAIETTPVNIRDWASAYGFPLSAAALSAIEIPLLVVRGGDSSPAMQRASAVLHERTRGSVLATIDGAAHFMIATHAGELASLIARHVDRAEAPASFRDAPSWAQTRNPEPSTVLDSGFARSAQN
jgi:pimeloyl-ACP methyl ester carboxylesterase